MTLKKDFLKLICYLLGHKPTKTLVAGFPIGLGIHEICTRCKDTLNWRRVSRMKRQEIDEIYRKLQDETIKFRNNTEQDTPEVLFSVQEYIEELRGRIV